MKVLIPRQQSKSLLQYTLQEYDPFISADNRLFLIRSLKFIKQVEKEYGLKNNFKIE